MYDDEAKKMVTRFLRLIQEHPTYPVVPIITYGTDKDEGTYSLGIVRECCVGEYLFTPDGRNVYLKDEADMENIEEVLRDYRTEENLAVLKRAGNEAMAEEYRKRLPWLVGIILDISS